MLPDFPETKKLFSAAFRQYMRRRARQVSPLGSVNQSVIHEGKTTRIARSDGSKSDSRLHEISGEGEIKSAEIESLTLERVLSIHDEMVAQLVRKQVGLTLDQLNREIPKSQTANANGKRLDASLLLDALERIEVGFFDDGRMHPLSLLGGAITRERMQELDKEIRETPILRERFAEIVRRKREEWRDREASRTLVG